ncbi:unnamed protein product [Durusdinium trenchii]|uniref:Uncharacterized protein n=2 Tax=Durusdinium trenchii TaxID=1381693 RepID=A0ABP0K5A9_9DINO
MQDRWRVQRVPRAEPEMAMEMWFIFSSVLLLQCPFTQAADPLKTWLGSLQLRFPDSDQQSEDEGEESSAYFKYHDLECHNLRFDMIHSGRMRSDEDPVLGLLIDGVAIDCSGAFTATSYLTSLSVGSGTFTAKLTDNNGPRFEILFDRLHHSMPDLYQLRRLRCEIAFAAEVELGKESYVLWAADRILKILRPFTSMLFQKAIEKQACSALDEILQVKLDPYVQEMNNLFFPSGRKLAAVGASSELLATDDQPTTTTPPANWSNSSDDKSASSNETPVDPRADPKLYDWQTSTFLQWGNWFATKVLPPEVARELFAAADVEFLKYDLADLHLPPFQFEIDQHETAGLRLHISVVMREIYFKGIEGVQAYAVEAESPSQLRGSLNLGTEEHPAMTMGLKLQITVEAKSTAEGAAPTASLVEEISFMVGAKQPSVSVQVRVPCGLEKMMKSNTIAQLLVDPENCLRSFLLEAPSLEWMNVTFQGLSTPLSYIANTEGQLEQDISDFFNVMVTIFNELYEAHLPGAIARLTTSDKGLNLINSMLQKHLSPSECISEQDAQQQVKERYPEKFNNWPELLDGQIQGYVHQIIHGLLKANETAVPQGWLEMPPINVGALRDVHLKDAKVTGTSQISQLQLLETNAKAPDTIAFDMEASCPTEQKNFPSSLVMTVAGTLDETGEALVQVDLPCGKLHTTLNLSVDVLEASTLLFPPSVFCTLLSPFEQIIITRLDAEDQGAGKLFVTLGSSDRRELLEEMCNLHPRLCSFMSRVGRSYGSAENATLLLQYLHQEAVGLCDAMVGSARRLLEMKDEAGVAYEELNVGLVAFTLGGVAVIWGLLMIVLAQVIRRSPSHPLTKINTNFGVPFVLATTLLLVLALCLRCLAYFKLAYFSMDMNIVYKPSRKVIDSLTLAAFTFQGLAHQLSKVSGFLGFEWNFSGLGLSLTLVVLFMLTWLVNLPFNKQHILLRVCIWFSRRQWQELGMLLLTAFTSTADIAMPLDIEQQMRMTIWSGPVIASASTMCLTAAGLCMLMTVPTGSSDGEKSSVAMGIDLALGSGIITGLAIFLICDFVEVGFVAVAGYVMSPQTFAGYQVGDSSAFTKLAFLLIVVIAPIGQVLMVSFRCFGLKMPYQRLLEEICMGFNCIDIFAIIYFMGFLPIVDGFTVSLVEGKFMQQCEVLATLTGEKCIGVDAKAVTFGTLGLVLAAVCTLALYIRSSYELHQLVSNPTTRRDEETRAVELPGV